jgi:hypothetical protein
VYRQKVDNLAEALNEECTCTEVAECIRELIEEIRLVPDKGKLKVELYGQLAALINLANEHPRKGGASNAGCGGLQPPRVDSAADNDLTTIRSNRGLDGDCLRA